MRCPECAGREVRAIAPGYYECRSFRGDVHWVPDVTRPGEMRPLDERRVCGHLWHEASDGQTQSQVCSQCGTFAIGLCPVCGTPVCGDHSRLITGKRLCLLHARAAHAEVERKKADSAERERLRSEAVRAAATARDRRAEEALQEVLRSLASAGYPGLGRRVRSFSEKRFLSKKYRRVEEDLPSGWHIGELTWKWDVSGISGRAGDFNVQSGEVSVDTAVLPSGEFVQANIDELNRPGPGKVTLVRSTLQVERAVGALTAYAASREPPKWEKRGPEPGNLMYRVIEELEKAQAAADALLDESGSPDQTLAWQAAMVRLERAEAEVAELLPHVRPTWLVGGAGERIIRCQETARLTRALSAGRTEGAQ